MPALIALLLLSLPLLAQYQGKPAAAPPESLNAATRALLSDSGMQVVNAKGETAMQFWFRKEAPEKAPQGESNATLSDYAHGVFLGVVQVTGEQISDRRGDRIAPGLYMLRLSFHPEDGAHQGVATQRDFLILTKADTDTDPAATPAFMPLMKMAQAASGTNHPLSLSCWQQDNEFTAGLAKHGESDFVLQTKVGDLPLAIIVIGRHEG
jgi:hypothetical protein